MNQSSEVEFAALMRRVKDGEPGAAEELFTRYGHAVRRVVRRTLRENLRRQYDSTDFEQSVWASFFNVSAERNDFPTPQALVAFLSRMAHNKVVDATRRRFGARRDARREERSLDAPSGPDNQTPFGEELAGPTNTPSQYVMANERWHKLIHNLPSGHVRILEMLQAGHSQADVARELGFDPKSLRRILARLNKIVLSS